MSFDLSPSKTRLRDVSQVIWKRASGDPRHPCNASDADWQAGYLLGCFTTAKEAADDIEIEWNRRGKPGSASQYDDTIPERARASAFKAWKAGYWAGRYTRL